MVLWIHWHWKWIIIRCFIQFQVFHLYLMGLVVPSLMHSTGLAFRIFARTKRHFDFIIGNIDFDATIRLAFTTNPQTKWIKSPIPLMTFNQLECYAKWSGSRRRLIDISQNEFTISSFTSDTWLSGIRRWLWIIHLLGKNSQCSSFWIDRIDHLINNPFYWKRPIGGKPSNCNNSTKA